MLQNSTENYTNYAEDAKLTGEASAVSRQMSLINKQLQEHREIQGLIGQRLHAALRPGGSVAAEGSSSPAVNRAPAPIVADLVAFTDTLNQLAAGYQDILDRLEL